MKLSAPVQERLIQCTDFIFSKRPQPHPARARLQSCKIVSHRGEHDNSSIYENTIQAFDMAVDRGIWGIEFDIRWTKDLHPVVIHDPDLKRLYNLDLKICDMTRKELCSLCPLIPSLSDIIQRYGKKVHLMAEIKAEAYPEPLMQNNILGECFAGLRHQEDYHLLSLTPAMFDLITFAPKSAFLPVATTNLNQLSKLALAKEYRGVAGHYFLLTKAILTKHIQKGQKVGTGYPNSKNCLFREINRGVEWIFSNNAGDLQAMAKMFSQK